MLLRLEKESIYSTDDELMEQKSSSCHLIRVLVDSAVSWLDVSRAKHGVSLSVRVLASSHFSWQSEIIDWNSCPYSMHTAH